MCNTTHSYACNDSLIRVTKLILPFRVFVLFCFVLFCFVEINWSPVFFMDLSKQVACAHALCCCLVAVCCSVVVCCNVVVCFVETNWSLACWWTFRDNFAYDTGWQRPTERLKLQVIFHKRATNYRALLQKMTFQLFEATCVCIWHRVAKTHRMPKGASHFPQKSH
jgi:hypothetical protein